MTADVLLQTFALGSPPWPTVDPFLFCVHHVDRYPAGDHRFGPVEPLTGRSLGQDFSAKDGWSMYHGRTVPGFPQHPHRGFETVTFVRRGLIDHSDSLGAAARYGQGDVQWMTAGRGIVHAEMFPLLETDRANPAELFQIWLNLPRADKFAEPYFSMLWNEDIPRQVVVDAAGRRSTITVVAGAVGDLVPPAPPPPPRSWGARPESDLAIWHAQLDAGAECILPPAAAADTGRVLYVFGGSGVRIGDTEVAAPMGAVLRGNAAAALVAGPGGAECLLLQGRPIGEPVAQYGPFVMNDRAGIEQAFEDYRRTQFGGWPWPVDDPVHGREGRFARRSDGTVEQPPAVEVR